MQIVYIDLIPQKEKPIVNLSQYDNDRIVRFMLLDNGEEYTLTGTETIDVNIKKPDGNIVVINPTVTVNHYVDVLFTEQAAACYGQSVGELSIKENSTIIGTCNFIMDVEKSPTCGGIQSATEIENLQSQIDDIISGEGYLKAEDVAQVALSGDYNDLTNKPDMSDYYTKSQTDALLNNKVDNSTLSSYYTKSQTDVLLNNKVDNSTLSSYYTKSETEALIDNRLLDIMPVETQTGNPCSFDTDIATALQNLTADIVASGGGGTPSTPIPIVGHSELNLVRCGKNLYSIEQGAYDQNMFDGSGNIVHYPDINLVMLPVEGGSAYSFMFGNTPTLSTYVRIAYVDANGGFISREGPYANTQFPKTITMPNNCKFIQLQINENDQAHISDNDWLFGVIKGSDMPYEPYNGTPYLVQFGQTVYGGEFDANRGKVKPNVYYPLYNGEAITGRWLSSKDVYVEGNTPTTGAQVICLDEYDTEIDVPELSVAAIVGVNNIISDCVGDVTATYKVSIQKYVDDRT